MYNKGYLAKALYGLKYIAEGLYGILSNLRPPCEEKLVQWVKAPENGVYEDLVGVRDSDTRIGGWHLSSGTISTGLVSTALSYVDATTLATVNDTTDGNGDFIIPANGMADLTIDGHYFPIEESTGGYIGATDGTYYAVATPTWVASDFVPQYADENGFTDIADGNNQWWDELLRFQIPIGVKITSGAGWTFDSDNVRDQLKVSGMDFAIIANQADGASDGINSPFTTPFVELMNRNNIDLQNFDETTSDGWVNIIAPSGKTQPYLNFDGIDSYGSGSDNISEIDILGLDEFIFFAYFKHPSVLQEGWIFSKREDGATSTQIALYLGANGDARVNLGGTAYVMVPSGTLQPDTFYKLYIRRENGRLICELDDVETYNSPNTKNIATSQPYFRIGARTANSTGTSHQTYFKGHVSHVMIGKNPNFATAKLAISNSLEGYSSNTLFARGFLYGDEILHEDSILKG